MASASSSSARTLFGESKSRLADRVKVNIENIASVAREINRNSKSNEILSQSIRTFVNLDHTIDNTETNIKKLDRIKSHLGQQQDYIVQNSHLLEGLKEQVNAMQR
uniref:BLOC-1-related complex subunit 7 n=1 Tax=Cacopsylla melanoneura TaxID=428564 RepID=A0A8D8XMW9_9HEMI